MAPSDIGLLRLCVEYTMEHADFTYETIMNELQDSGATSPVTGLRMLTLQSHILAIGTFSVFEALLQEATGWQKPFKELDTLLRSKNEVEMAETFKDYRLAVNVLKHGRGDSYRSLLQRKSRLAFVVKEPQEHFSSEGDVSEVAGLIIADYSFVRGCTEIIERTTALIRANSNIFL